MKELKVEFASGKTRVLPNVESIEVKKEKYKELILPIAPRTHEIDIEDEISIDDLIDRLKIAKEDGFEKVKTIAYEVDGGFSVEDGSFSESYYTSKLVVTE